MTLQGFWNCIFHVGVNTKSIGKNINRVWSSIVSGRSSGPFFSTASKFSDEYSKSAKESKKESTAPL